MLNDKVIIIQLDDWVIVYFNGKLFAEGHDLEDVKWIKLGMLMQEADIDISEIINVDINENDVSEEYILWDWSNNINDLDKELGERLQEFVKFNFKKKNNRIIFAGYMVDKNNKERLVIGESECSITDKFDSVIGKLIAVRKSLGMKIDDVCEIVEPKHNTGGFIVKELSGFEIKNGYGETVLKWQ